MAVAAFQKLNQPEFDDIASKLTYCIGSYNYDRNPTGLVEYGFRALEMLKEVRRKFPKKVSASVINSLEDSLN
jgi:hypothetical protein